MSYEILFGVRRYSNNVSLVCVYSARAVILKDGTLRLISGWTGGKRIEKRNKAHEHGKGEERETEAKQVGQHCRHGLHDSVQQYLFYFRSIFHVMFFNKANK